MSRGKPGTLASLLDQCPFRSLIGTPSGEVSHTFAALGGKPSAIGATVLADMVLSIRAGKRVLVLSDRADLRDRAKAEIVGMLAPAAGQA